MEINLDEVTSEMEQLKDAKARLEFELKEVKKKIEKNELILIAVLNQNNVNEYQHGVYTFGWRTKTRTAFDQALFKEKEPDLFEQFKVTKETQDFVFNIN